ncbi:Exosome complex component RRP45 [Lamellibrachia satsuma]|nr:Exosome complex component RRP45 [Lamellibrachia satsuma]
MREIPLSNCEKEFLLNGIVEKQRLDGRGTYDYRKVTITFGTDRGCCHVQIGDTRAMAQVSCEVTTPKQTRPNEGLLYVNVELSPMAAPHFEAGRPSQQGVELSRCLERCLKESRCIDTESLCIMSGTKVWSIRVDVHVLNHEGNLIDACSMAAITALAHFSWLVSLAGLNDLSHWLYSLAGPTGWSHWLVSLAGLAGWSHWLVSLAGLTGWYSWLVSLAGLNGCTRWLVPLAGLTGWSHWLVSLAGLAGWSRWLVSLAGLTGWSHWLVSLAGTVGWSHWLVSMAVLAGWSHWLVSVAGLTGWYSWLVPLAGLSGWSHWLVSLAGLTGWYSWLVSLAGLAGWSHWLVQLAGLTGCSQWLVSLAVLAGWYSWLVSLAGLNVWSHWLVQLAGLTGWSHWLVSLAGLTGWSHWLVSLAGTVGWSHWLVSMSGLTGWYSWLVSLAGLTGWYSWLVSMVGLSGCTRWLVPLAGPTGWSQWLFSLGWRPDVTVSGEDVTIHSLEDQDPIALGVHHMPICVSFAFFHQGKYLLVDPNEMEERVMDGKMVIGMNKHRELVTLQLTGSMLLHKDQVLRCTQIASLKVQEMTALIEEALKNDTHERATGGQFGSASSKNTRHVTSVTMEKEMEEVDTGALKELARAVVRQGRESDEDSPGMTQDPVVTILGKQTGRIGEGGLSSWDVEEVEEDVEMVGEAKVKASDRESTTLSHISIDSSEESEEDVTETLAAHHLGVHETAHGASGDATIDLTAALNRQKPATTGRGKSKVKR